MVNMMRIQIILLSTILKDLLFLNHLIRRANAQITFNFVLKDKKLKSKILLRRFDNIEAANLCGIQCLSYREKCRSINYNPTTKQCEILPHNVDVYEEDQFENAVNWVYYGTRLVSNIKNYNLFRI